MGELINLNKHRKARAKTEARAQADSNAVKFGLSKAEKSRDEALRSIERAKLEAHLRESDTSEKPEDPEA